MTKTELFAYIKNVGYPFWELAMVDGFKANRLRVYKCEDIAADATPEEKMNSSLNALEITLSSFKPTDKFRITLKNSETANGSGIYGPVEFLNMATDPNAAAMMPQQQNGGFSGFSGLPDFSKLRALGYVPESEYTAKLEAAKLEQQKALMEMEFRIKEDNLKRDYDRKKADLRRQIEDYQKRAEEASSTVNKLVAAGKKILPPLLARLMGMQPDALGTADEGNSNEVEVKDPKYIEIEKMATELYDSHASLEDIQELRNNLKQCNYEFHSEEAHSHTSQE